MKQVIQNINDGSLELMEVCCPAIEANSVLIRSRASLISSGTERMLLDFGRANLVGKMRQQPDKVDLLLNKIKTDGVFATLQAVRDKLAEPISPGYSNAGVVLDTGSNITEFKKGDRVACNGTHSEIVIGQKNLCVRIPDQVSDESAAFTVVGAIALQGIRVLAPEFGEAIVVTGLGLIGQITVQLLRAHGCRVLAIDLDARKLTVARAFGAETVDLSTGENPLSAAERFSRGRGVDGVIITASTKSNEPIHQAALMCRKRGRIVLVGVTGLDLSRDDFYKKELSFQVSCSYGPGRYDSTYEQEGHDYPYPYVRWTAQRNFEAILDMMADGRLDVAPLITHRFPFDRALEAYQLLESNNFYLGILFEYPSVHSDLQLLSRQVALGHSESSHLAAAGTLGFIGAGGYATKTLIPAFSKAGAHLASIASNRGLSSAHAARRFGFREATTDVTTILKNPTIDTVAIATRHDSHAALVCQTLKSGKHVFVEKPLALDLEEIAEIESAMLFHPSPPLLMVGFNRRFAPHVTKMRELLSKVPGAKAFVYTVNAGAVPAEHWTRNAKIGGGRIIGEVCHFIDLLRFLADAPTRSMYSTEMNAHGTSLSISFEDGSAGNIHYWVNGHKSFPKERLEVFAGNRILQLDNFRKLTGFGWPGFHSMNLWKQDKGANACVASFIKAVREGRPSPIPFSDLIEVARLTISAASRSKQGTCSSC